jgi:hypothetical protein
MQRAGWVRARNGTGRSRDLKATRPVPLRRAPKTYSITDRLSLPVGEHRGARQRRRTCHRHRGRPRFWHRGSGWARCRASDARSPAMRTRRNARTKDRRHGVERQFAARGGVLLGDEDTGLAAGEKAEVFEGRRSAGGRRRRRIIRWSTSTSAKALGPATRNAREEMKSSIRLTIGISTLSPVPSR